MSEHDFYGTLGVPRTASEGEIRKAYRALARKFHPDKNPGNKQAEERFKDIAHASEVLLNKRKRELYDEFGEIGLKEGFNVDTARQSRRYQGARGSGGSGPNLEDLFGGRGGGWTGGTDGFQDFMGGSGVEELFRRAGRRQPRQEPPPELVSELKLGFTEALRGGERELQLGIPGEAAPRVLKVRIPAGVKDGGQIRLRNQGMAGGDLVLKISVGEHPHFRRDGDDLLLNLPITVAEAYRGAKIAVPTLDGEVTLTVPKGAKGGAKLRLRGKGVPKGGQEAGDLIVTLQIRLPEGEDEAVDHLIGELEAKYASSPRSNIVL
ncbi:MAG TPA: J domain-containing protein [Polyangiales bacterium]